MPPGLCWMLWDHGHRASDHSTVCVLFFKRNKTPQLFPTPTLTYTHAETWPIQRCFLLGFYSYFMPLLGEPDPDKPQRETNLPAPWCGHRSFLYKNTGHGGIASWPSAPSPKLKGKYWRYGRWPDSFPRGPDRTWPFSTGGNYTHCFHLLSVALPGSSRKADSGFVLWCNFFVRTEFFDYSQTGYLLAWSVISSYAQGNN